MKFVHVVHEYLSNLQCSEGVLNWYEVTILRELVNYHQQCIEVVSSWKPFNKVHANNLPCLIWYW